MPAHQDAGHPDHTPMHVHVNLSPVVLIECLHWGALLASRNGGLAGRQKAGGTLLSRKGLGKPSGKTYKNVGEDRKDAGHNGCNDTEQDTLQGMGAAQPLTQACHAP